MVNPSGRADSSDFPDSASIYTEVQSLDHDIVPENHVRSLIRSEYDSTSVKHLWLNGVMNAATTNDISDSTLRLFRVDLRGSHLYVYRAPSHLNTRLFKPGDSDESTDTTRPEARMDSLHRSGSTDSSAHSTAASALVGKLRNMSLGSSTIDASETTAISTSEYVPAITYFSTAIPFPGLQYDVASQTFLAGSSTESLVHFYLFADETTSSAPVQQLQCVLPMLPRFGDVLKTFHSFLTHIFAGDFGEKVDISDITHRVLRLLHHVADSFSGFLLKADVAPQMLKIIELFMSQAPPKSLELILDFKNKMLAKQRELLDLLNTVDSAMTGSTSQSPVQAMGADVFINHTNLFLLATTITKIDAQFFAQWNSSKDKSLLLYSSVSDLSMGNMLFYTKNPLIFNNECHIHYLSRLLVYHLFLENPNITAEERARILEKWIDLGCLLDKMGNMSSWLGISSIVLSQPILRLTEVWHQVSLDYIKLLKNDWSPVLFELDKYHLTNIYEKNPFGSQLGQTDADLFAASKESYHIMVPRGLGKIYPKESVIPYFGDLLVNNNSPTTISELEAIWKKVNFSFDRWHDYFNGLYNFDEVIQYNQDVLRRYDSMGFLFTNESLNQVLYLGVNKDNEKTIPATVKSKSEGVPPADNDVDHEMHKKLLRLIDYNCDSINLDFLMKYSLECEPCIPEKYLKYVEEPITNKVQKLGFASSSSLSVNSLGSVASASDIPEGSEPSITVSKPISENSSPDDEIPLFNNNYFKINLLKYEDLYPTITDGDGDEKHNIVVDDDLTLRIDDFVADSDGSFTAAVSDQDETMDDDGLGIDVDDILNSDKFKNFTISDSGEIPRLSIDRKRSSFGLVSVNSTAAHLSHVVKYIPRFASMDKLIDLLLIDLKYFDEDYTLDLTEYRFVFMLTYSSFLTTRELLEKLAHRFVHSGNAVISVMKKQHLMKEGKYDPMIFGSFPNWDADPQTNLGELGDVNYELLLKIQINILKVLIVLINNFFPQFFNDFKNKKIMIKFLKLYSNEILQWYNSNKITKDLEKPFESLVSYYKRLKKSFVKKCYRPVELLKSEEFFSNELKILSSMNEVPINRNLPSFKNVHKIEKFLSKFNKMLAVFYKGITPESWFETFKILENLFVNHSLLSFNLQKPTISDESMLISNVFSYFETLHDLSSKDLVLNKLPLVFKMLFRVYFKFKSYILLQLCDILITMEERFERMKTLLVMLKITKLKMSDSQFVFEGDQKDIPSCIETALTNAIYSPESRYFSEMWVRAAQSLHRKEVANANLGFNIEWLLPQNLTHSDLLMPSESLLPCFGWIIENLISINKCPSYYRSKINFNKRYLIYKVIRELSIEEVDDNDIATNETKEFDFLLRLDESKVPLVQEMKQTIPQDRISRFLFRSILQAQHTILAVDNRKKSIRDARAHLEIPSTPSHAQVTRKLSSNALKRQSLSYKTNSSSRFKISGLFSKSRTFGLNSNGSERVVLFQELPDPNTVIETKSKPTVIIQLKDKKIFPVYSLSNCFKIDSESGGGSFVFQAPTDSDSKDWLRKLCYANRHWFYSKQITARTNHDFTTFGVPLTLVCSRGKSNTPEFLDVIYELIEREGLKDVGIYRISTSITELANLKNEIDTIGYIDLKLKAVDVHSLTSCVKLYFRELPDAVLTDEVIESLYKLGQERPPKEAGDEKFDRAAYREVVNKLPFNHYETFKALLRHLNKVYNASEENRMTASNLATVIGPALTEASGLESLVTNFGMINYALERLIERYQEVFEDTE